MSTRSEAHTTSELERRAVERVYHQMIECWNRRDAACLAISFALDGQVIGFDGSQMLGREAIRVELDQIFRDHATPSYVCRVDAVQFIRDDVAQLRASVGMVLPGGSDIAPELTAIQLVTLSREDGHWQIESFQNTPAQLHQRPDLLQALTASLREIYQQRPGVGA